MIPALNKIKQPHEVLSLNILRPLLHSLVVNDTVVDRLSLNFVTASIFLLF